MMWKTVSLGDLLEVQNGYAFNSKQFSATDGMPLIRIRDLKNGISTKTYYAGKYENKYVVHAGDYLIGMDGEFRCYQWKGKDALLNQRVCRLQNFTKQLNPRFMHYVIDKELKSIEDKTGFITVKHLSSNKIKEIQLSIPPLSEQQRIVAKLDAAFAKIDMTITAAERKQEEVDKLKQAILVKEFEFGGNTIKLSDICTLRNGRAYKKVELLNEGKYPVLRVGNFFTKNKWYYSDLELDDSKYCKNGDLLYAWSASFGPHIWEGKKIIYHYHIWRVDIDESVVDKWFLYHWFEFDKESIKAASGTGTTMMHVSKGSMERRKINLPSLTEQKRIATKINSAFSDIKVLRKSIVKQIVNYKVLKSAILNQELQKKTAA